MECNDPSMKNSNLIIPGNDLYIPSQQYFPNAQNSVDISLEYEVNRRFIEFPKSMKWLELIGVKVKNSRFEKYLEAIDFDKKIILFDDIEKGMNSNFNALREIDELNWIAESFSGVEISENVKSLLNKLVTGSEFRGDDKASSAGRNTSFHLRIAGYFARSKIFTDVENPWDVEASYKDRKIVLEAKRISSFKKISRRIGEAKNQIHKNVILEKNEKAFGIIAVDTYEFMFNSNVVNCFKNIEECTKAIRNYFQVLSDTSWVGKEKDKIKKSRSRVHLIWINSMIPCFLEEEDTYFTRFQSLFIPIKSRFTPDGQYCQELTDYLSMYFKSPRLIIA